jgi:hypothetical protein
MGFVTVKVMLVLVEYLYFGAAVSRARARHNVSAPTTTADIQGAAVSTRMRSALARPCALPPAR